MSHESENVEQGLTYLALSHGRARKASRKMQEDGLQAVPASTLHRWKTSVYPGRYMEIRQRVEKQRDGETAELAEAVMRRAIAAANKTLDKYDPEKLEDRDRPRAFKDIATGGAIFQDKAQILQGKPTEIHMPSLDFAEVERLIAALENEALENGAKGRVVDAEVVTEELEEGTGD